MCTDYSWSRINFWLFFTQVQYIIMKIWLSIAYRISFERTGPSLVDSDEICWLCGWNRVGTPESSTPRHGKSTSSSAFHSNVTAERHNTRLGNVHPAAVRLGAKFGGHGRWKKSCDDQVRLVGFFRMIYKVIIYTFWLLYTLNFRWCRISSIKSIIDMTLEIASRQNMWRNQSKPVLLRSPFLLPCIGSLPLSWANIHYENPYHQNKYRMFPSKPTLYIFVIIRFFYLCLYIDWFSCWLRPPQTEKKKYQTYDSASKLSIYIIYKSLLHMNLKKSKNASNYHSKKEKKQQNNFLGTPKKNKNSLPTSLLAPPTWRRKPTKQWPLWHHKSPWPWWDQRLPPRHLQICREAKLPSTPEPNNPCMACLPTFGWFF